ncbi:MAG: fructose-bisphosphate aldolase class II, partial [Verrucomicrobiales bacterium]
HALDHRYAILAVNADSPAAIVDCLEAARQCQSPIIIETSLWQLTGHSFGLGDPILGMKRYLTDLVVLTQSERYRHLPVVYHTDHIKGPQTLTILQGAIRGLPLSFGETDLCVCASSISLDSSELSVEENLATIATLCQTAQEAGVDATLEMEAGVDDGVTSLDEARALFGAAEVANPGYLALWAPGVGTKHGLGSAGGFDPEAVARHRELASELAGRAIGIALHGSSGLSQEQLQAAVAAGVAKVNWSSESLLIRSGAAREFYQNHGEQLTKGHAEFKETAMDNGVQQVVSQIYIPRVVERLETLNSAGKAPVPEA